MKTLIRPNNLRFLSPGYFARLNRSLLLPVLLATGAAFAFGPVTASAAPGQRDAAPGHASPTPVGFNKYLVYMGESTVGPNEPGLFMDSVNVGIFQHQVMQRSSLEVMLERQRAKVFFWQRFGLDFRSTQPNATGMETIEGAMFVAFVQNPKANYRAYTIAEEAVPATGWMVRDGGWAVILTKDMLVGGSYGGANGKAVAAGAMVVFGDYNIKVENASTQARPHANETIVIHYESGFPIVANSDGVLTFQCALSHPTWGLGRARGVVEGKTIRNVLTFPPELP